MANSLPPPVQHQVSLVPLLLVSVALAALLLYLVSFMQRKVKTVRAPSKPGHKELDTAREQLRAYRKEARTLRDVARPSQFIAGLSRGAVFGELLNYAQLGGAADSAASEHWGLFSRKSRSAAHTKLETKKVMLRLEGGTAIAVYDADKVQEGGPVPLSTSPLYVIDLHRLERLSFGSPFHPAADAKGTAKSSRGRSQMAGVSGGAQGTADAGVEALEGWRCLLISTGDEGGGDHCFVAADSDELALVWFQGLQYVLQAVGELTQPVPRSRLLWERARMRLTLLAARRRIPKARALASAVRAAERQR